jgi:hypothetical protein
MYLTLLAVNLLVVATRRYRHVNNQDKIFLRAVRLFTLQTVSFHYCKFRGSASEDIKCYILY